MTSVKFNDSCATCREMFSIGMEVYTEHGRLFCSEDCLDYCSDSLFAKVGDQVWDQVRDKVGD
jgi:hypothetical protein